MIWVVGCKGMLGRQICAELDQAGASYTGTDLEVDITDLNALAQHADGKKFEWIVNCSAYTAVDKAESEPEKARLVNAVGPCNLAILAEKLNARLVHFSTDYVYDGFLGRPYVESDQTNPLCVYGRTKLEGERLVWEHTRKAFIIRISWLYGRHGANFVKTMLRLFAERTEVNVVNDQVGSPTYAGVLAENVARLVRSGSERYGVYLYADDGYISWFDFAVRIKAFADELGLPIKEVMVNPIPTEKYPTPAKRPGNSRFDKSKIKETLGVKVLGWEENLRCYFEKMKEMRKE